MKKTEDLVSILKKLASNDSKKVFPEGLGPYNINDKDAQALYILLKDNVDIEELNTIRNKEYERLRYDRSVWEGNYQGTTYLNVIHCPTRC